ncbi:MAG: Unknown protein [uncultured Campylobacterales bacterium]|uniref:Uncharacterized protein n=1 Tax=uncultured Campylobacterales bacterium TaxID=352960 RepID=A0A6S6SZA9_9BACT|nr:MAG: Unknown protein [uncultured Campylobacterales bacterium]
MAEIIKSKEDNSKVEKHPVSDKITLFEYLIMILCYLVLIISLLYGNEDLFQRSGSLVIIFVVFTQNKQTILQQKIIQYYNDKIGYHQDCPIEYKKSYQRKIFDSLILFTIVLGTVIWGYGDLIYKCIHHF